MALPKVGDQGGNVVVDFGQIQVTFQLRVIPGPVYNAILRHHNASEIETLGDLREAVGPMILTHGVAASYSSEVATPEPWELSPRGDEEAPEDYVKRVGVHADAGEVCRDWPPFAVRQVVDSVMVYSTGGPRADPFGKSTPSESGDG